jgi:hypothetical protein
MRCTFDDEQRELLGQIRAWQYGESGCGGAKDGFVARAPNVPNCSGLCSYSVGDPRLPAQLTSRAARAGE